MYVEDLPCVQTLRRKNMFTWNDQAELRSAEHERKKNYTDILDAGTVRAYSTHLRVGAGLDCVREHTQGVVHACDHRRAHEVRRARVTLHDVYQVGRTAFAEGDLGTR